MSGTTQHAVWRSTLAVMLAAVSISVMCTERDALADDGPRFDAIGDSITWGEPFRFSLSAGGSIVRSEAEFQGWPEMLGASLASDFDVRQLVRNRGEPGATVMMLTERYPRIWFNAIKQADVLLLIGTNDSNPAIGTPSGYGCVDEACVGTFAAQIERLVRNLLSQGRESIYVALVPPVWGNSELDIFEEPLSQTATRNQVIREYNRVISEHILSIPGVRAGPDFFSCFLTAEANRYSLFDDVLHPNALGQAVMAAVWRSWLAGKQGDRCRIPIYIVESLDSYRYGHKQNLLSVGDEYYVDEEHVILNVPGELASGIWITPANVHRDSAAEDYLVFDAGDNPVDVYIAYDPSGGPPTSVSHQFAPVRLSSSLEVSDRAVTNFETVVATGAIGHVQIAGPGSSGRGGKQQSYLVIVVP